MVYVSLSRPSKPKGNLGARIYPVRPERRSEKRYSILTIPFDFLAGNQLDPELEHKLYLELNTEIEQGRTYPNEETLSEEGFRSYFLAFDLVLGLFLTESQTNNFLDPGLSDDTARHSPDGLSISSEQLSGIGIGRCNSSAGIIANTSPTNSELDLSKWDDTYAFSYYIKPNYPGRGSHLCNAGFIVSQELRGLGLGTIAGRTFLHYGPGCGYRGSVFNLVYASNAASLRIWERLGFRQIGIVPEAGRLKKADGSGEEFVDACVVHGDFRQIGTFKLD